MTDLNATINLIREYKDIAYRAGQFEEAIRNSYLELVDFNDSPENAATNGYLLANELGAELAMRVLAGKTISPYWFR
jgi:hypothetical protein